MMSQKLVRQEFLIYVQEILNYKYLYSYSYFAAHCVGFKL